MALRLKTEQAQNLRLLADRPIEQVVELCKISYDFLINGNKSSEHFGILAKKYGTDPDTMVKAIEALISLLVDCSKLNSSDADIKNLRQETNFKPEILEILSQFYASKRQFIESSSNQANLRAYRIVNIEWRLETKFASRCLHKQSNVFVVMKLYLHTEPKNENRDLLTEGENNIIHPEERRNRKDILVQTDIMNLMRMIQTLEDALTESRTRRIKNVVAAIH